MGGLDVGRHKNRANRHVVYFTVRYVLTKYVSIYSIHVGTYTGQKVDTYRYLYIEEYQ